ncbi:MAG: hypothetical protein LBH24_04355 [Clostridiales bacterium]|jgi:hypothetical protein|nr:hypothetical protein [Clostridiales bacterium]
MGKEDGGKLEKFFDILGEILAVVMVVTLVVNLTNAQWHYMDVTSTAYKIFDNIQFYGFIVLTLVIGAEAVTKRNWVFKIVFLLAAAFIIIFSFLPDVRANLIDLIPA